MDLFPLPLSFVERLMQLDRDPRYPALFMAEVEVRGEVVREVLLRTLPETLDHHPLLWARIEDGCRWVLPAEPQAPEIVWLEAASPCLEGTRRSFDLERENGLRIWCQQGERSWTLIFEVDHRCTDGTGMLGFALDWLRAYESGVDGRAPSSGLGVDPGLLRNRDLICHGRVGLNSRGVPGWLGWIEDVWEFLRDRPSVLPRRHPVPADLPVLSELRQRTLDEKLVERLRVTARRCGGTPNDLLASQLILVLKDWWKRSGLSEPRSLHLIVPTDQRRREDLRAPAMNKLGWAFLRVHPGSWQSFDRLLPEVIEDTNRIKSRDLGGLFFRYMAQLDRIPGLLPLLMMVPMDFGSALLSNLGRIAKPSRMRLDALGQSDSRLLEMVCRVTGGPTLRRGAAVSILATTLMGRTTLGAHFDRSVFDRHEQETFMDLYVAALEGCAGAPG